MTEEERIVVTRDGLVANIELNDPPLNRLGIALFDALEEAVDELAIDDSVRAIVLRGAGGKNFSVGADIREFGIAASERGVKDFIGQRLAVIRRIETMPKPVICAIRGACLGGGLEIALGCHFRIATRDAKIGLPEVELGVVPAWGGTQRLTRTIGRARALDVILRAKKLSADEALDRVCNAFAQVIDAKSPWTARHSVGVAEISVGMATVLGFDPPRVQNLWRAALLHDIGKLGVSNQILDKAGKLTDAEFAEVKKHPAYTYEILRRVHCFEPFADLAASHHEKLDGSGYHRGLTGRQLSTDARVLAVADLYEALAARRPYRVELDERQVHRILADEAGRTICPEAHAALLEFLRNSDFQPHELAA